MIERTRSIQKASMSQRIWVFANTWCLEDASVSEGVDEREDSVIPGNYNSSEHLDCDGNVYGRDPLNLPSDLLTA